MTWMMSKYIFNGCEWGRGEQWAVAPVPDWHVYTHHPPPQADYNLSSGWFVKLCQTWSTGWSFLKPLFSMSSQDVWPINELCEDPILVMQKKYDF